MGCWPRRRVSRTDHRRSRPPIKTLREVGSVEMRHPRSDWGHSLLSASSAASRAPRENDDGLRTDAAGDLQTDRVRRGWQDAQLGQAATTASGPGGRRARRPILIRARPTTQLRVTNRNPGARRPGTAGSIPGDFAAWDLLALGFGRSCFRSVRRRTCPAADRRHRIRSGDTAGGCLSASRSALSPVAGVGVVQCPRQRSNFADRRRASARRCPRSGCGGSHLRGCSVS